MSSRFVTQSTEEKIPISLECSQEIFRTTLESLMDAAGFRLATSNEEGIYARLIVDFPGDFEVKKASTHSPDNQTKVVLVSFDSSRRGEWQRLYPNLVELHYIGVISPLETSLSLLDSALRTHIFDESCILSGSECSFFWFEDVCHHIIHELLSGKPKNNTFVSETLITLTQIAQDIRTHLHIKQGSEERRFDLPIFQGIPITGRPYNVVVDAVSKCLLSFEPQAEPENGKEVKIKPETKQEQSTSSSHTSIQRKIPTQTSATQTIHKKRISRKKRIKTALIGFSCTLGILLAFGYSLYALDLRFLAQDIKSLTYTSPSRLESTVLKRTRARIARMSFLASASDSLTSWMKQGNPSELHEALPLISSGVDGYEEVQIAQEEMYQAYQALMQNKNGDPSTLMKSADSHLDNAYKNFSLVQARLSQGDTLFPHELGGKEIQEELVSELPILRRLITTERSVLGVIPNLVSGNKQRSYAIVLEDSSTLRGGGGTVEAVAVLTFDKAKLFTLQVYPVGNLAQMVTGNVIPPDEVKNYLRTPTWTLQDASWDGSYGKVAAQISWFLGKALSRPIDGVISIPSNALPSLLSALGPLPLEKSGGDVTAQNYRVRLEEKIAALPQKPDSLTVFYTDILTALTVKLQQAGRADTENIMSSFNQQFTNSNLFVGVGDEEAQRTFGALSWDGVPLTPACPSAFSGGQCSVNTAYEVENSLGQNSINAFIKRSHVHTIRVGSDVLLHSRIITLTNTSSLLAWPYGTYQVLIKLFVDEHALIQSVSVNDRALTPDQFSLTKEAGKLVIRLNTDVLISSTSRVRIAYTTPGIPQTNGSLVFFEQKQAGTDEDPFTLIVTYPDTYAPKSVAPRADVGRSSLTFSGKHDANRLFGIGF